MKSNLEPLRVESRQGQEEETRKQKSRTDYPKRCDRPRCRRKINSKSNLTALFARSNTYGFKYKNTSEAEKSEKVLGLGLASGEIGDVCGWCGQGRVGHLHRSAAGRVGLRLSKLPLGLQSGSEKEKETHLITPHLEQNMSHHTPIIRKRTDEKNKLIKLMSLNMKLPMNKEKRKATPLSFTSMHGGHASFTTTDRQEVSTSFTE